MKKTETKYGLLHKKTEKLLSYYEESNSDAEFCVSSTCILSNYDYHDPWLVDEPEVAEWVRHHSTPWYNAERHCPKNPFKPEELESVKVTVTTVVKSVQVELPTDMELAECYYGAVRKNNEHLNYLKDLAEEVGWKGFTGMADYMIKLSACRSAGYFKD